MPEKAKRPSIGIPPLTRPQYERLELSPLELREFWHIILRSSDIDWGTMRIWSHILFFNR